MRFRVGLVSNPKPHLDHGELAQLCLSLRALAERGGPARVGGDLRGEEACELAHGRVDDLLVTLADPGQGEG